MTGIYIASKVGYAARWRRLRDKAGYQIISTWIDEAKPGQSEDLADLWTRCVDEAKSASCLILYREDGDDLKGAWVELGVALAACVPLIIAIGIGRFTVASHPRIRLCSSMENALALYSRFFAGTSA